MTEYENDNQCQCNKQHNCKPYFKEKENNDSQGIHPKTRPLANSTTNHTP